MMFTQPFYVSPHAVKSFRERVADLPTRKVRAIIQAALQDNRQKVLVGIYDHQPHPIYRARFCDVEYLVPAIKERRKKDGWPVVLTILLPGMSLGTIIGERSGWSWS